MGKPKGDKRSRTRARLIAAAAEVIGEKGFERTSLAEVAERAGMSRGAIYGNFSNKDELLFGFVESRWPPVKPELRACAPLREQLAILGAAIAKAADERRPVAVGALSFQSYLLTHERARAGMAAMNEQIYRTIEADLLAHVPAEALPMPVGDFVRVLHALADGLMFARFLDPDSYPDRVVIAAFEALAPPSP